MDAIVTARVPAEVKEQGSAVLREIGATPTQLVNAAYRYLLSERKLPQGPKAAAAGRRTPTADQMRRIDASLSIMRLEPADPNGRRPFGQMLSEARDERYAEHLA